MCTVLGNGVAIYCDRNCHHGEYNTRAENSELVDQDMFKYVKINMSGSQNFSDGS